MTGSPTSSERPSPVDIIEFFKTRSSLVVAAVAALDALPVELAKLKVMIVARNPSDASRQLQAIEGIVESATIGADNLLIAPPGSALEPFVLCSVNRQPSGTVDVRTIELDRDALALMGANRGSSPRPLNQLKIAIEAFVSEPAFQPLAVRDAATVAIDTLSGQVRVSISRLSIVKARLDLQQSFLASVMEADIAAPFVRLDSHLDQAGARDMALEARRLLSNRSLNIASGNRKTLTSLFESHAAQVE